jgi:hypothetical protein
MSNRRERREIRFPKQTKRPIEFDNLSKLPVPEIGFFDWKSAPKHPLIPLLVSCFVAGVGKNMQMILWGLGLCTLWLFADLWPLADWISVKIANLYCRFPRHSQNARQCAEDRRRGIRRGQRAIVFTTLASVVICLLSVVVRFVVGNAITDKQGDAYQNLVGELPMPQSRDLNDAKFTLTNNSSQIIRIKTVSCYLLSARLEGNISLGSDAITPPPYDTNLYPGGDAQQWGCALAQYLNRDGLATCADIDWNVKYSIQSEPQKMVFKRYRFSLNQGDNKWHRTANGADTMNCKENSQ